MFAAKVYYDEEVHDDKGDSYDEKDDDLEDQEDVHPLVVGGSSHL